MLEILLDDDVEDNWPQHQQWQGDVAMAVKHTFNHLALALHDAPLCIRLANDATVQQLNCDWRNKDNVTDVLSFPMQEDPSFRPDEPLGDIILAVPFVMQEAARLQLAVEAHALHLIVHGLLHLLGYDHIDDDEAQLMQQQEQQVMQMLGLHHPYLDGL